MSGESAESILERMRNILRSCSERVKNNQEWANRTIRAGKLSEGRNASIDKGYERGLADGRIATCDEERGRL